MNKNLYFRLLLPLLLVQSIFSQTIEQKQWFGEFSKAKAIQWQQERAYAESMAVKLGIPIRQEYPDGSVIELQRFENGRPVYYETHNLDAAKTISTNRVWPGGTGGFSLTGASPDTLGIWDAGRVWLNHQELTGRVTQKDNATSDNNHATHVAGTMIASGVEANAKGMSYQGRLNAYDWNNDDAEMASAASAGLRTSNHSYGYITGWYGTGSWYGNTTISVTEDYYFGFYSSEAQEWDNISRNAPNYLIVKSAGNDRLEGPSTQPVTHSHLGSGSFTCIHDRDGAPNGYDCISHAGVAKNILTVGAVDDIVAGYSHPSNVVMSYFSSWGPTDDGRIKPDIMANGVGLYSSTATNNSSYATYSGTSMSSPNVTGSLGLLLQYRRIIAGSSPMRASTLKGLVIHTADEAGTNPGPDYVFGWGLMNTLKAAQVMRLDSAQGLNKYIRELTLSQGQTIDIPVYSDGTQPLRATICWTDLAGTPPVASLDPPTIMLVNDVDLRLIGGATTYNPWILNPSNPSAAATTGDNIRDNVEQVHIASPISGSYTIRISHKGTLASGSQVVSLIITGIVPTATLSIQNTVQTALDKFQFSIYLKNTGALTFGYLAGQYHFDFNKNILGSGTGSMAIISSELLPAFRPINPSVVTTTTPGQLRWEPNPNSDGGPLLNTGDSIKVMTVEFTSTVNLLPFTPDLVWRTSEIPQTILTKYNSGNAGTGTSLTITNYYNWGENPVLPVQLSFFIGSFITKNSVKLEWETLTEINNYGFYVQKFEAASNEFITIEESFQPGAGYTLEPQYYTWTDENVSGSMIQYRLLQLDNDGLEHFYGPITVNFGPTEIKETRTIPNKFELCQNYPNPFNPETKISYALPEPCYVTLKVYNLLGQEITTLVDGFKEAGYHSVSFNTANLLTGYASGVYYYQLKAGSYTDVKKLLLMK